MSIDALVIQLLEDAVEDLSQDLQILKQQMLANKEGMFITYSMEFQKERLVVYAPLKYKAYVPKKYKGLDVEFKVWDGGNLELDLDLSIRMD
jgi:hypothetical protein